MFSLNSSDDDAVRWGGAAEPARSHDVPVEGAAYYLSELKLELIWVDAGSFLMGSSATEADRDEAKGPQTQVALSHEFWLGETEVTQARNTRP